MAIPELEQVGRYTIKRVLGQGAMGVVYEGFDPRLNRRVAIKTILKSHLGEDTAKEYSARFEREAHAVARLGHPNIVQVHDFGEEGDLAYIVMEFIEGRELKSYFDAKEHFSIKDAVRIMRELCDALEFAHRAGVIHRDIKPANVMLDREARVKLTDFGVARLQETTRSHATATGVMVGTPAYMSPEQIRGEAADQRTDIFSAGIVLYQFLTHEMPFGSGGPWTIAKRIMQDDPAQPSAINASVPAAFDEVINKALAKEPPRRYQTAREFGAALEQALEGKLADDDPERTVAPAMPPAPQAVAEAAPEPAPRSGDAEIEFWRSIKDGNEPTDFELYLEQFPDGIYAKLARSRIAKLRGLDSQKSGISQVGGPTRRSRMPVILAVCFLIVAAAGAGAWFITTSATKPLKPSTEPAIAAKPEAKPEAKPQADRPPAEKASAPRVAKKKVEKQTTEASAVPAKRERTFFEKLWHRAD